MNIPYILTDTSVTVIINFTPKIIDNKNPNFNQVINLLKSGNATEQELLTLLDIPTTIKTFTGGNVYVKNGKLYHNGAEVRTSLGQIIMKFVRQGQPELAEPLKLFLANVAQNPDPRAQIDLYDWVQASGLPITSDGYLLAWKAVTNEYRSLHTPNDPRFDHHIGNRVEQERDQCDANPERTCSSGLHFCGAVYLGSYLGGGARIVVVKIHPRDIVSFPTDYSLQKGRACGYDVVGEVPGDRVKDYYPQGVPVYAGFDSVAKPKPAPVGVKAELGGVYRRRDGTPAVVVRIEDDEYAYTHDGHALFAETGRANYPENEDRPYDLVAKIEFPLNEDDFFVGDRWVTRGGKTVTINEIKGTLLNCSHTTLWKKNGKIWLDRNSSDDLVFNLDFKKDHTEITQQFDLKNGDKVRTREGKVVTVVDSNGSICKTTGWVHNKTGLCAGAQVGKPVPYTQPQDVIKVIERAKVRGTFEVGDVWETRNGQKTKIVEIKKGNHLPIECDNGAEYYPDGRYSLSNFSSIDLIKRIV